MTLPFVFATLPAGNVPAFDLDANFNACAQNGANTDITSLASPALAAATATTQASNDRSTKVATTAFVNPAATLAVTGHMTMPNGLQVKWGQVTTSGAGDVNFIWAGPAITTIYGAWATGVNGGGAGSVLASLGASSTTAINVGGYISNTAVRVAAAVWVMVIGI